MAIGDRMTSIESGGEKPEGFRPKERDFRWSVRVLSYDFRLLRGIVEFVACFVHIYCSGRSRLVVLGIRLIAGVLLGP